MMMRLLNIYIELDHLLMYKQWIYTKKNDKRQQMSWRMRIFQHIYTNA